MMSHHHGRQRVCACYCWRESEIVDVPASSVPTRLTIRCRTSFGSNSTLITATTSISTITNRWRSTKLFSRSPICPDACSHFGRKRCRPLPRCNVCNEMRDVSKSYSTLQMDNQIKFHSCACERFATLTTAFFSSNLSNGLTSVRLASQSDTSSTVCMCQLSICVQMAELWVNHVQFVVGGMAELSQWRISCDCGERARCVESFDWFMYMFATLLLDFQLFHLLFVVLFLCL